MQRRDVLVVLAQMVASCDDLLARYCCLDRWAAHIAVVTLEDANDALDASLVNFAISSIVNVEYAAHLLVCFRHFLRREPVAVYLDRHVLSLLHVVIEEPALLSVLLASKRSLFRIQIKVRRVVVVGTLAVLVDL